VFRELGVRPDEVSLTGGAVRSVVLCQIMGKVIGMRLRRVAADTTARGAAMLAACAAGRFPQWQEAPRAWPLDGEVFAPQRSEEYERAYQRFRTLYPQLSAFSTE